MLKAEPDAPRSQRDLSVSYAMIGDVQRAQGDLSSALSSHQQGLQIAQKLAARDPANTELQRDLSVSYERIGDVQRAQGDLSSALSSYKQGLEIRQKLAARDPANTDWQRNLSVSYNKIGDVQSAQGDLSLSSYKQGLEIAQKLAARDPANAEWQRDLSVSCIRIGDVQKGEGFLCEVAAMLRAAVALQKQKAELSPQTFSDLRQALQHKAVQLLEPPRSEPNEEAVRNRLHKQRDHLFTFLDHDGVEATNNLAERQLRPAVIAQNLLRQ